jgi:hypothetical protein
MNILPSLVKSAPPLALTSNATGPLCSSAAAPGAMHVTIVDDTRTAALPLTATSPNLHCTSPAVYPDPITLTIVPPVFVLRENFETFETFSTTIPLELISFIVKIKFMKYYSICFVVFLVLDIDIIVLNVIFV